MDESKSGIAGIASWPVRARDYIKELQAEMRRVTWPNRKQVEATTAVVIVTVFAFAAYFAVIDSIFTRLIARVLQVFAKQT
jgi:preprotein translocase subunit SecE